MHVKGRKMSLLFSLLFCFFTAEASAAPTLKRLCITSKIHNHEPTNRLALEDIKNQQFYIFVELKNCNKSKFFLKVTTPSGILKRAFHTQKAQRYRTYYKFTNIAHIKNIKVTDAAGNVIGTSIINTKSPNADKKTAKKAKPRGIKKLLQSMQD